ncbi:MAG TPA: hypothetical protein VLJ76_02370 [Gaiellaceae bacterium]|nr:hypothetical protein [Gaiellaceae bacterium]
MTRHDEHADDDRLELEPETVKDLDVDERDAEHVQGGQSYGASAPTHQN